MSDNIEDLAKRYEQNVFNLEHPRKIGLFPIPEYPELEGHGMWSEALNVLLTTLRYLAPATLLTLFWGQQSFLFRLLKSIDNAFRAIVFSSEEQKQSVLKWLSEAGPVRVEHLNTVWHHGWIVCGVLDTALPGACAGHPPTRLSLKHAQAIADHYLGVEPAFTRQELESNDSLSRHQEWKLANYLDRIREALSKISPPVSKPPSQRTSQETTQFTLDYVAKGSGLTATQVNNKMYFKIYPSAQQSLDPGALNVLIRGPKDTYGMAVLPPILGKAQMIRQKLLGLETKHNFTENALPITQGATYMRNYGKNDMNKTYYIPKTTYDIDIEIDVQEDHIKIGYAVPCEGKHEISITSRGYHIVGSPFTVTASHDIINILENDNFYLEDGEEVDIVGGKGDKKVVLRIVDFITEKMLLKENGVLEKISDDEANCLLSNEMKQSNKSKCLDENLKLTNFSKDNEKECITFRKAANKIVQMNRVCKIIRDYNLKDKQKSPKIGKPLKRQRSHQQDIPDIVNSTFSDLNYNPFVVSDKPDKVIIPENISVSLKTEKSKSEDEMKPITEIYSPLSTPIDSNTPDSLEKYETLEQQIEEEISERPLSASNPFLNDIIEQNFALEKDLGSFVKTEYETNNSQGEETSDTPIKIVVEADDTSTPSPFNTNPFFELDPDIIHLKRPKTPVLKIISGEINDTSVFIDPKAALTEEMLANEFINPFFLHRHDKNQKESVTDFIIGAPVSLPPLLRAPTPEPMMESILITGSDDNQDIVDNSEKTANANEVFSTPLNTNTKRETSNVSSTFHSLESNISDHSDMIFHNHKHEPESMEVFQSERNVTPRKDMWDSAYVSIDDGNSSPDNNNNDNNSQGETPSKPKFLLSDENYLLSNIGPAERELWQNCNELKQDIPKIIEEVKPSKWDTKRLIFTPIIEESDKSLSSGTKEVQRSDKITQPTEIDSVTLAFAEIDHMYHDHTPTSESNVMTMINETTNGLDIKSKSKNDVKSVDSASDMLTDVKRHAEEKEGQISEVQANVTESVSVSQTLHQNKYRLPTKQNENDSKTNIVKERKQYWDEKIREIEAKSEETKTQQRRRRLSSKYFRHNDSLTKRRGKQIVKNLINVSENRTPNTKQSHIKEVLSAKSLLPQMQPGDSQSEIKLVDKWKKYWDSKLDTEKDEVDSSCFSRAKSPKSNENSLNCHKYNDDLSKDIQESKVKQSSSPVKQELPEEVFKAFETSPKRFFGTSRKQILNKIDTFLGKPNSTDSTSPETSAANPDTGLVSSRISLFHNITHTEELPWVRRKCQSLHNIFQRKDSDESTASVDESLISNNYSPKINKRIDIKESNESISELKKISLKDRRARMVQNINNKTFDESITTISQVPESPVSNVHKVVKLCSKPVQPIKQCTPNTLRKSSVSKSEMDIFSKTTNNEDDLDKYKSCDELPKINVKNFISLYESVSRTNITSKSSSVKNIIKSKDSGLQNKSEISLYSGTVNSGFNNTNKVKLSATKTRTKSESYSEDIICNLTKSSFPTLNDSTSTDTSLEHVDNRIENQKCTSQRNNWTGINGKNTKSADSPKTEPEAISPQDIDKETTYLSLSDIELEIVESADKSDSSPEKEILTAATDYKSRFKMAKQYFQSLEELREIKKPKKLNECELLLKNKSTESLENERPRKRVKKNIKAHSMPSTEISKIWNQLQESQSDINKLVKISEKFNVEDLFVDVTEGKLSRQGSLRGIPHKKAVLETFRSMENISDKNLSPYELAVSQLNEFAKENKIKNAQTYLSEYPYLPTTDPSKYQSRVDTKASGLISLKELISQKPRRNSVPDLRMNAKFTDNL